MNMWMKGYYSHIFITAFLSNVLESLRNNESSVIIMINREMNNNVF